MYLRYKVIAQTTTDPVVAEQAAIDYTEYCHPVCGD